VRTPARRIALLALLLLLTACVPGSTAPTPPLVAPPANPGTPAIITASPTPFGRIAIAPTAAPGAPPGPTSGPTSGVPARPPSAAPVPRSAAPRDVKLTHDGCCPLPQWLPDSSGVYYYGNPSAGDGRRGTWRVPREGGPPQALSALAGGFSRDLSLVAYLENGVAHLARPDGTPVGALGTAGARPHLAPTNDRVAWFVPAPGVPIVSVSLDPPVLVAVARPEGAEARTLPAVFISETLQWFPDGRRLLVQGRDSRAEHPGLWVLDTTTGTATLILERPWLEMPLISPDGQRIAYTATLQPDPAANGVWLVNADGSDPRRLPLTGGYRWTPDSAALLHLPAPTDRPTDELWRYTLATGAHIPLVTADQPPFAVAQDEWEIAPDGTAIAYRSATDGAIHTLRFAP